VGNFLEIGKAHQRIIREKKQQTDTGDLFGFPQNPDIKTSVCKEITYEQAKQIILEYEWLGTMGTTNKHFGILFDNQLAGAICFGYFQAMGKRGKRTHPYEIYIGKENVMKGVQLSRGACAWWAHEHSGSKLIAYGLNEMSKLGYKYVVAFSDPDAGEIGTIYQATNWHYLGFPRSSTHYDIYYKTGKLFMNDRDIYKKYGFAGKGKMDDFIKDKPELEVRLRKAKARYIKLIGNKYENKAMMQNLKDKIQPYPKRNPNGFEKNESAAGKIF
jgi:hypothetical protein